MIWIAISTGEFLYSESSLISDRYCEYTHGQQELHKYLHDHGFDQYILRFQWHGVDMDQFCQLNHGVLDQMEIYVSEFMCNQSYSHTIRALVTETAYLSSRVSLGLKESSGSARLAEMKSM